MNDQNGREFPHAAEKPHGLYQGESKSIFMIFLELFFSRWILISLVFGSGTAWAYLTLKAASDTYEANGQILIQRGAHNVMRNVPIMRHQEEVGSEIDILLSIAVINETVDQLLEDARRGEQIDLEGSSLIFGTYPASRPRTVIGVGDLPSLDPEVLFKYLKDRVRVRKFGESNVLEVSLVSPSPAFAAAAVNTLIDVYEKFNLNIDQAPGSSAFYEREINEVDDEINSLQSQLVALKQSHGVADAKKEQELLALRRHALLGELDKIQVDKRALEVDLQAIKTEQGRQGASFLRNDQTIGALRLSLFSQRSALAELMSKLTAENPLVIAKREEVEQLERNLKEEEEIAIAQQRHVYEQLITKERELLLKIGEAEQKLATFPELEAELDRYDRNISQRTIKRIDMVEQMFKTSTLEQSEPSLNKVKVLGYASIPQFPREARKGFKFMVAVVFCSIAAFVVGVFVDSLDHSVRKREEIEEQLHVPYLASLSSHYR